MKKTVYVVCVCVLFVLLFYEVKRNYETENDGTIIVPTGSFVSKVQKENQKTAYLTFAVSYTHLTLPTILRV
mgnify:CR=1 FL=1